VGSTLKKESRKPNEANQDTFLIDTQTDVFAVFDGLGGPASGEKASQSAAMSVQQSFAHFPATQDVEVMKRWMAESLIEASRRIQAESMGDRRGTTASVLKLWEGPDGKRQAIIGNVGDSRVYAYRAKTGKLEQLTIDDSSVLTTNANAVNFLPRLFAEEVGGEKNDLYRDMQRFLEQTGFTKDEIFASAPKTRAEARAIQQAVNEAETDKDFALLSPYAKFYFEFNHVVSQALGDKQGVLPQVRVTDVEAGDVFLLMSDGIQDNISDGRMREIVASGGTAGDIARELTIAARLASHAFSFRRKPDDMTVVAVAIP
jgi:serine/threonine protein phosphatase PrpC